MLIHHQRSGHTPIALVGSATAVIGDPSGRSSERRQLDAKEVVENSKRLEKNIRKIFENHENFIWKMKGSSTKHIKLPEPK